MDNVFVAATISVERPTSVKANRKCVHKWLRGEFYNHDADFTIQEADRVVARVMSNVDVDFSSVEGEDFRSQLNKLWEKARETFVEKHSGLSLDDVWQFDVLFSG